MAVTFDIGNGTSVYIENNAFLVDTQRGMVAASDVVQGDFIYNVSFTLSRNEVVSAPVVT